MQFAWYDFIGTVGVTMIIVTHFFLQLRKIKSEDLFYSLLNVSGAGMVAFSLLFDFNFSAFIVELFWMLVSMIGVVRNLRERRTSV